MRRIIVLVLLAAAAIGAWRYYSHSYAPVATYKKFAEHIVWRRYDEAAKLCDGLTADDLKEQGSQERIGPGPQMFQTLFPSRFEIESQEPAPDGALTIHAKQTVLFNPAGVESALRPAMYAILRQNVTMHRAGSAWKITSFENTFEKMDSTSGR